jgi:iron complex outermembrane receptor protein
VRVGLSFAATAILLGGTAAAQQAGQPATELPQVEVIGASPLIGSGVDRNTVPAEKHVLNSNDLKREGTSDLLQ